MYVKYLTIYLTLKQNFEVLMNCKHVYTLYCLWWSICCEYSMQFYEFIHNICVLFIYFIYL